MSAYPSILVHMDDSPACAVRLRIANAWAEAHESNVTALYAVMPAFMQYAVAYAGSAEVVPMMQDFEAQRRTRARKLFDETVGTAMPRVRWDELTGEPTWAMSHRALLADLVVLGQRDTKEDRHAGLPFDFVESIVLASGKPALVVPSIPVAEAPGRVVALAWKETRESARAVAAAMPVLQRARQVHVLCWDDKAAPLQRDAPLDIERHLRDRGVAVKMHRQGPASRELGEHLLSAVADHEADLLVMGCYGHGRAREWALGGATRTVLQAMTVPVLMAH
jgi:nucleotide-binding universal stress UspA family protein